MGVGFAKDSEGSQRNNERLRKYSTDKYYRSKHKYKKGASLNYKGPLSESAREKIKETIKDQKRKERAKVLVVIFILVLLSLLIIFS